MADDRELEITRVLMAVASGEPQAADKLKLSGQNMRSGSWAPMAIPTRSPRQIMICIGR